MMAPGVPSGVQARGHSKDKEPINLPCKLFSWLWGGATGAHTTPVLEDVRIPLGGQDERGKLLIEDRMTREACVLQ